MNRRNFLKTSAAAAVATAVFNRKAFAQADPDYRRSLHFVYGIGNNATLDNTDQALKSAFGQVTGGVTCLCPFLLNSLDPMNNSNFTNMINWVQNNGVIVTPAVGLTAQGNTLNNASNKAIAQGYFDLGTHIRLENLSGDYDNPGGASDVKGFIDTCIGIGFTKIMLNPWPVNSNGTYMTFDSDQIACIDSAFQNVNPSTWELNSSAIEIINGLDSAVQILVNYESPGPQSTIAAMSHANQLNVFNTTLSDIGTFPISDHLHWAPPFTQSYDPLDENTWNFIANTVSGFQG
jgi:anaerobic selenocysteine-containing dehydrogenase